MPNMTGIDLAREIAAIRQDIPVILCTGFDATISKSAAKELGIQTVLNKPIRMKDLARAVRSVLDREAPVRNGLS